MVALETYTIETDSLQWLESKALQYVTFKLSHKFHGFQFFFFFYFFLRESSNLKRSMQTNSRKSKYQANLRQALMAGAVAGIAVDTVLYPLGMS